MIKKILVVLLTLCLLAGIASAGYLTTPSTAISVTNSTPDNLRLGNASADQTITLNKADYNNNPRTFMITVNPGTYNVILKAATGDTIGGQVAIQSTDLGSSVRLIPDPILNTYKIADQIGIWNISETRGDLTVDALTAASIAGDLADVGDLGDLDTSEQGSIVGAINETEAEIGDALAWIALNETAIGVVVADVGANETRIISLEGNDTVHDADIVANATKADNALAWVALNETALGDAVADIVSNATKADNALAWLALNDTRIDDVVIDIGANDSRVTTLEGYVSHLNVIAGGAVGNHVLAGIATGDELNGVLYVAKGAQNLTAVTDVGSEFSTNATATRITNWGGTDTSGGYLIVGWTDKTA